MIVAQELYSERLYYRDITERDATQIVQWRSNPDVYKYFASPHKLTVEEHLNWYKTSYVYDKNRFDWIVFNSVDQPIGIFGVKRDAIQSNEAEVSYILDPKQYGKGYAREAVDRLIVFCKEVWQVKAVIARIHKENNNSIIFAEKLGFVRKEKNGDFIRYVKVL